MTFPTDEFKIELIRYHLTQKKLADYFGVHRSLVAQVVNNFCSSPIRNRMLRMLGDMQAKKFTRLEGY